MERIETQRIAYRTELTENFTVFNIIGDFINLINTNIFSVSSVQAVQDGPNDTR